MSQIAGTVAAMSSVMTIRPPYRSVQIPRGTRIKDPVKTGVAVRRPNCVAFRFNNFLMGMPMTPNIIHTMKQTVNARVLTIKTDHALRWCVISIWIYLLLLIRWVCRKEKTLNIHLKWLELLWFWLAQVVQYETQQRQQQPPLLDHLNKISRAKNSTLK